MGTNIEVYAEVSDGDRWRSAEPLVENEDYDPENKPLEPRLRPESLYYGKGLKLSTILTDEKVFGPLRGLPADVSPDISDFDRPRHDDGHFMHSWLSLEELLAFDWHGRIDQQEAMVDVDLSHLFEGNPLGFPWEGWPRYKPFPYSRWLQGGVRVRWRETPATLVGPDFMESVLTKLKSFGPAKSVRIVFWFWC